MINPSCVVAVVLVLESSGSAFRTQVTPRLDPVFGDTNSLRRSVDRFMKLQGEMDLVGDEFSNAVHQTLAALAKAGTDPTAGVAVDKTGGKEKKDRCRPAVTAAYARARVAGAHYLALGRELDLQMRQIRSAESYGDTIALTPDYRLKVERARRDHADLLRRFREMQVAFHDQLEAEMRFAGCEVANFPIEELTADDDPALDLQEDVKREAAPAHTASVPPPSPAAPVAGIVIDSTHCRERSQLTIDGKPMGPVEGNRRTLVRLAQGPHDLCVLPASDARKCGDSGTIRHAYVHDGWVLEVRCTK